MATLVSLSPGLADANIYTRLILNSFLVQAICFTTLALICALSPYLVNLGLTKRLVSVVLVFMSVTFWVSALIYSFYVSAPWGSNLELFPFLLNNLAVASLIVMLGIPLYQLHKERSEMLAAQSRAELDALQSRIRPHFIFNCLNSAAELTHQDPQLAEHYLLNLSKLLRATIHAGELTSLQDELSLVKSYLDLENCRLGNRLSVIWQIPDTLPSVKIPTLTLQPLVENAVHHGIEPQIGGGEVSIQIEIIKQQLVIRVENTCPVNQLQVSEGNRMALENIRQRLYLVYSDQAKLQTKQLENRYHVKLTLEYHG